MLRYLLHNLEAIGFNMKTRLTDDVLLLPSSFDLLAKVIFIESNGDLKDGLMPDGQTNLFVEMLAAS